MIEIGGSRYVKSDEIKSIYGGQSAVFEISIMKLCVRGLLKTLSVRNFIVQPIYFW